MSLFNRIIRKTLLITSKKDSPRKVYFGPLKGYKWIYNSGYSAYWMGSYESVLVKAFIEAVKSSTVVYDLGAHIGYYTLIASKYIKKGGKVYAFEPFPKNFEKLEIHKKLNLLGNVTIINAAVANNDGVISFSNNSNDSANTYVADSFMFKNFEHIQVNAVTLDSFIESSQSSQPDLIKMDVEGAELDVLKGATGILEKYHPKIFLSTHNCQNHGIHKKCIDFLTNLGYSFKYFDLRKRETEFDDPWYEIIAEHKGAS
jgi:FkbM family methyltransferase